MSRKSKKLSPLHEWQILYRVPSPLNQLLSLGPLLSTYHKNPKYWDRQACANSVDPDQMPQNAASDQGLHCLPLVQQYFKHINR